MTKRINGRYSKEFRNEAAKFRITSYNVCYTKLLRREIENSSLFTEQDFLQRLQLESGSDLADGLEFFAEDQNLLLLLIRDIDIAVSISGKIDGLQEGPLLLV